MRRREFITLLGGAAAWPLAARAQQGDRVRRIGVLMWGEENDSVPKTFVSAFIQALADLGRTDGRNVRLDLRWGGTDINRIRALAQELVGLQPDIILTGTTPVAPAVHRETRTIHASCLTWLPVISLQPRPCGHLSWSVPRRVGHVRPQRGRRPSR